MGFGRERRLRSMLVAAVLAMAVMPIATAGAKGAATSKASTAKLAKQVKALKKQTAALIGQVAALKAQLGSQPGAAAPSPLTGPAGGDLTGNYPNPQLRAGSIVSADILDGAIASQDIAQNSILSSNIFNGTIVSDDIANGSVGALDLATDSVGTNQLANVFPVEGAHNVVGNGDTGGADASCPPFSQLIAGGAHWNSEDPEHPEQFIVSSGPSRQNPNGTWEAGGLNRSGAARELFVTVLCLSA